MYIYKDIYLPMKKPVRPMHAINLEHLRSRYYFDDVVEVISQMGLHPLMMLQCNYNISLVHQFFSTLVLKGDDAQTLRWMSGPTPCESNFYRFAELLGYSFDGPNTTGQCLHAPGRPSKDKLYDLYEETGVVGTITGLLPLYDQLLRIFRATIAPSGGNNDAIRSALVNLLALAHDCPIDVMDYIFH